MTDATTYRARIVDNHLAELFSEFPAVMVTGPLAVGKTTTAAQLVDEIVHLDEPGSAASFRVDSDVLFASIRTCRSVELGTPAHH